MVLKSLPLLALVALSSCAYMTDESTQELTITTPGALNAECDVYVDNYRYKFVPPQTRFIFKSKEDLIVDCIAPGNRHKKLVFKPAIQTSTYMNAATGVVPGGLWDYASGAMFHYPREIEVDFTNVIAKPMPLPPHNAPDIIQPEAYQLEEFRPGLPRMTGDLDRAPIALEKRRRGQNPYDPVSSTGGMSSATAPVPLQGGSDVVLGKGDLMSVIDRLDPSVGPSPAASGDGNSQSGTGLDLPSSNAAGQ